MHCYDCPADSTAFSYTYNASKMYAESMHNKRMKRKQHSFLLTAYTVHAHKKAPTRKATHNSAFLLLMRAAQHIKGKPARRRASRAALHKVIKAFVYWHSTAPSTPHLLGQDAFLKNSASQDGRGDLWQDLPKFQHLGKFPEISRCNTHDPATNRVDEAMPTSTSPLSYYSACQQATHSHRIAKHSDASPKSNTAQKENLQPHLNCAANNTCGQSFEKPELSIPSARPWAEKVGANSQPFFERQLAGSHTCQLHALSNLLGRAHFTLDMAMEHYRQKCQHKDEPCFRWRDTYDAKHGFADALIQSLVESQGMPITEAGGTDLTGNTLPHN